MYPTGNFGYDLGDLRLKWPASGLTVLDVILKERVLRTERGIYVWLADTVTAFEGTFLLCE